MLCFSVFLIRGVYQPCRGKSPKSSAVHPHQRHGLSLDLLCGVFWCLSSSHPHGALLPNSPYSPFLQAFLHVGWGHARYAMAVGILCALSSSVLFNFYAEYIMRNAGLEETQAGIKITGRNINNLRYADDTTLMAESEELKSPLMKMKEESEKVGLKLNIQKTKIMASGPITSWQIDGEILETVSDSIFSGSKITADGDCSHEIKRRLILGRKVMTNVDSISKSRDITLPTKICLVKAMVFPVVMYGCESWTIKES